MKPTTKYFSALMSFLLCAPFFFNTAIAQPVIQVPPACNVVVTGSGVGVLPGFGGVVGSGGIVLMPDQYLGGPFNYIPNGTTLTGWSMQGDLSVQTPNIPPMPAVQSAPAVLSVPIQSYNENLRSAELANGGLYNARCKGRVNVGYSSIGCGGAGISFEVYKTYTGTTSGTGQFYIPPIVGDACWQPGKIYTYSVDQIASDNLADAIGLDNYYWSIVDAVGTPVAVTSDYYSADYSSYTFNAPISFSSYTLPFTIQVCYGRANQWDGNAGGLHTTCVTTSVTSLPALPVFSPAIPTCLNTGITSFTTTYTPEVGCTYAWTCSNSSWTLTPGPGSLSITTMDDNPGVLTLTITGPCLPATYTETINRSFDPAFTSISGPTCVDAGAPPYTYTLTSGSAVLDNVTCWTLPAGWSYTPANGAASIINLTVPPLTLPGAYTLTGYSCSCPGSPISITINVQPPAPTGITGPACVVRNGGPTVTYSCSAVTGATGYSWLLPTGWSCSGGCALNSTSLQPGGTSPGTDYLAVVALGTGGCNSVPSAAYAVNYDPVLPASISYDCFNFGISGTTHITVGSAPSSFYGYYTVTSVPSGLIVGTPTTDAYGVISMVTSATASGPYILYITHVTTSCGSSPTVAYPVTVAGNGAVLTAYYNPAPTGSDLYIVTGGPGTATFAWTINGVSVPGSSSFLALSSGTPPPGPICVLDSYNGCTTELCQPGGTHGFRMSGGTATTQVNFSELVKVYPNPNTGAFSVAIPDANSGATMHMIDALGKDVGQYTLQGGENNIADKGLAPGIYYLLLNSDNQYAVFKIEILK